MRVGGDDRRCKYDPAFGRPEGAIASKVGWYTGQLSRTIRRHQSASCRLSAGGIEALQMPGSWVEYEQNAFDGFK